MAGSIVDVLPSVAAVLGVAGADDRLGLAGRIGPVDRVAVLLVDGMGHRLLDRLSVHAPFLAGLLAAPTRAAATVDELSCTFPSTTPTSLVSLGTGVGPGEHGVLGFTVLVPGSDRVLTHILWRGDPPPSRWQPVPTWFARCAAAGVASRVVLPQPFAGSGLTTAAYGGARFCALAPGEDAAARIVGEVQAGPGLVFGYTAELDTAAHRFGIASPEWAQAAAGVDALLARVAAGLPPGSALVVTADHGGLDVPADGRIDLDADPRLAAGVRAVAGEPRARYLHTVDGATDDVLAAWRDILGDRADVLTRAEAVASGLFGPVRAEHLARIGDVVVIARGETIVLAGAHEPSEVGELVGFHGALTPAETAIPLITVSTA